MSNYYIDTTNNTSSGDIYLPNTLFITGSSTFTGIDWAFDWGKPLTMGEVKCFICGCVEKGFQLGEIAICFYCLLAGAISDIEKTKKRSMEIRMLQELKEKK